MEKDRKKSMQIVLDEGVDLYAGTDEDADPIATVDTLP
jgi:hypothetical protein